MNSSPSTSKRNDEQLRCAINGVFDKYDKDHSNTLDQSELKNVINDVFDQLKIPRKVKESDMSKFMTTVDKNSDGMVTRFELYEIFKKIGML